MALKNVSRTVQGYIPKIERESDNPTKIYYMPMTKEQYDDYVDKLVELRRNKVVSHGGKSGRFVYERCLHPNDNGIFIENVFGEDEKLVNIKDKKQAVEFLVNLTDVETANEIEQIMRGQSILEEEEAKN
jgi:hypothetical protein